MDLHECMAFKEEHTINLIEEMKSFMKPNPNLFTGWKLTMLKKLCDKNVTLMNKNSDIYRACRNKTSFRRFFLNTHDPVNW